MKLLKNELRRFACAFWMPAALAAVLAFLLFFFVKLSAGNIAPQDALLFLLSDRRYHGILYAMLALFVFGLDVESRAVDTQIMAGCSTEYIVLWKSLFYFVAVLVLNGIYAVVGLKIGGIRLSAAWQALAARFILDLGASAVFVILQLLFRTLQPTLIISAASAVVFIIAATPRYEMWFAAIGGVQPWELMAVSVVAVVLCTAASVVWLKIRYR